MLKKIWNNNLKRSHPIWYFCLLVAFSFSVLGLGYMILSKDIELDTSIQLGMVIGYLLVSLMLGMMLLGIFVNVVRTALYNKQILRYSKELINVEMNNKKLKKQIQKEK